MIKGMSPKEYMEMMQCLQKNCTLSNRNKPENVPFIKYVDSCYDTRTMTWWSIDFRTWGANTINIRTNIYLASDKETAPYGSLFDWCMAFLKGEWEATEKFYKNG